MLAIKRLIKKIKYISIGLIALFVLGGSINIDAQTAKKRKTVQKTTTQTKKKTTGVKDNRPKTSKEAKSKQAEVQKEIKLTEAQIKENDAKVGRGLEELGKLDVEIENTTAKIKQLNGELSKLNKGISTLEENISKNEEDLLKLREEYLKAVKKMRVTKKNKSDLAFIFSSKSLNQAMRRMRYLKEFSAWRGRQTHEISSKISDLKEEKESLAKMKSEQEIALTLQRNSNAKLESQHKQQQMIVADLKKQGKSLEEHLKRKQNEAKEINNLVSLLIAQEQQKAQEEARKRAEEERKKKEEQARQEALAQAREDKKPETQKGKTKENNKGSKKADTKKGDNQGYAEARKRVPRSGDNGSASTTTNVEEGFPGMKGKLPYPTTGSFAITSRFGRQNMPDMPDVEYENPGIDVESDAGAAARAVYKGRISGVYLLPGYNTVVIVNHGNYYTVYGNIASPYVKTGDNVEAGANLGVLAMNDDSNKSKLHFEVWKNREKLNPQEWLR